MSFTRKLKLRLYFAIAFLLVGVGLIVAGNLTGSQTAMSFGAMLLVLGIARILQYRRICRSPESLKYREIAETDERNVMLWTKARSLAFTVYIVLLALAVIVLQLLSQGETADIMSICLFGFVLIYWFCYFLVSKKY